MARGCGLAEVLGCHGEARRRGEDAPFLALGTSAWACLWEGMDQCGHVSAACARVWACGCVDVWMCRLCMHCARQPASHTPRPLLYALSSTPSPDRTSLPHPHSSRLACFCVCARITHFGYYVLRQVVLEKPPSSGSLSVEAWIGIGVGAAIALVLGAGAVVFGISRMHKAPDEKVGSATQGGGNQTVFEIRCDDAEVCVCVCSCVRECVCVRYIPNHASSPQTHLNPTP